MITAVWYILVYGTSAMLLLGSADPWLALPILVWFAGYAALLRLFVPRMRDTSVEVSEARSILTGRIVDTYTNILTLKLFARAREEDAYVRNSVEQHTGLFHASLRLNTLFTLTPVDAERGDGRFGRGTFDLSVDAGRGADRHRGDGAAAGLADRQHGRLGRLSDHRHFREYRRGAGRHARDRPPARPARQAGCEGTQGHARRDHVRGHPLRLWQREGPDRADCRFT